MNLELVRELTPAAFREVGAVQRTFRCPRTARVVVVSESGSLHWPGRTVYDAGPRTRVSLYGPEMDGRAPLAVFDGVGFPVNDVAFHPSEPVLAIAAGECQGGYVWVGWLLWWNWSTGEVRSLLADSRCVTRARFTDEGNVVALATVRLEGDGDGVAFGPDPARVEVVGVELPPVDVAPLVDEEDPRLAWLEPADPRAFGFTDRWLPPEDVSERPPALARNARFAVWDLTWLDDATLAVAHGGARVEVFRVDGELLARHDGAGAGVELVAPTADRPALLNVWVPPAEPTWDESAHNEVFALEDDGQHLRSVHRERGCCSMSAAVDGSVLLRGFLPYRDRPRRARVLGPDCDEVTTVDLGGYDVFHHGLKVDGADRFLALTGPVDDRHVTSISPEGLVTRTVSFGFGGRRVHAVGAGLGQRLALATTRHRTQPTPQHEGVVRLMRTDTLAVERELHVNGRVSAVAWLPDGASLCVALLEPGRPGELWLTDDTGHTQERVPVEHAGVQSSPMSLAVRDERLAVGTHDGRVLLYRVRRS